MPESNRAEVKLYLMLSELWPMADPLDLRSLVEFARVAEQAGVHGVELGEHIVMGPNSAFLGIPNNPRAWVGEGTQQPEYPHPSSTVLLGAMAAVTERIRLLAAGMITPLRHPLIVAKELATLDRLSRGRLIVLPVVSWQREEYEALGVPFEQRGKILDEQLEIWKKLWTHGSPISHQGERFRFTDIHIQPPHYRDGGPELWISGKSSSPWSRRRAAKYAKGYFMVRPPTADDIAELADEMARVGRSISELELAAFVRGAVFPDATSVMSLDEAMVDVPAMIERGITNLIIKPSQFIDDPAQLGDLCRTALRKIDSLTAG